MAAFNFEAERPVLPSLHSLGLLGPSLRSMNPSYESKCHKFALPRLQVPQWRGSRQVSPSSSSTSRSSSPAIFDIDSSSSRSLSPVSEIDADADIPTPLTPVLSISPLSQGTITPSEAHPVRFRLEPCSLADAQAIVLVPPPNAPFIPSSSVPNPTQNQQALLLLGHSLDYFRQPGRPIAKGARIHPYRITPSQRKAARRS
ncbi:hypothetical protein H0H93_001218 [Arthromyces matolae]|nr:hypothetical protein H0H93_001218 [Arthromyces matolae]